MAYCYSCKHEFDDRTMVYRNTECELCGKELHVCLNCRFHDPSARWECHETIPEAVREKDRANFCDYFSLKTGSPASAGASGSDNPASREDRARADVRKLFGDG